MDKKKRRFLPICCIVLIVVAVVAALLLYKHTIKTTNPEDIPLHTLKSQPEYADDDEDGDGLTNKEEKEYGTHILKTDTDGDTLSDYFELNESNTDPLKADTDEDGLKDGHELCFALNPLKEKTDGKTLDSKREFETDYEVSECKLHVEGNADIAGIYANISDCGDVSKTPGVIGNVYEFYMEKQTFSKAVVTLSYDENFVTKHGYNEDKLAVYQLLNDGTFKNVGGTVNKEENSVTVELPHFSKYVLADSSVINNNITSKVLLLLDNSGSMYSKDVVSSSGENDVDFKRVDMAKELINRCDETISFGLAKFTATYTGLSDGFHSSEEELCNSLESIKTEPEDFNGTYIARSIREALNNFDEKDNSSRKFIVLLTDGETTELGWLYDENDAIEEANQKNVSIIVVGLGSGVDTTYLTKITNGTGGTYVYANNSDALDNVYDAITAGLNYNMVDLDDDGENDSILMADSGFNISKDALNFENYIVQTYYNDEPTYGQCYGIAAFTQLQYKGKLPIKGKEVVKYNAFNALTTLINGAAYLECKDYNLSTIDFFSNEGKYANNKNNLKSYIFYEPYIKIAQMKNKYVRDEDDTSLLRFNDEIQKIINNSQLLSVEKLEHSPSVWNEDYKEYSSHERLCINLNINPKELRKEELNAYNFILMIHNFYSQQGLDNTREYNINSSWVFSGEDGDKQDKAFNMLIADLNDGTVPLLAAGGHAVNAISLYRDIEDPCKYTLYLYDNNNCNNTEKIIIMKEKIVYGKESEHDGFKLPSANDWDSGGYDYYFYDTNNVFADGENPIVTGVFRVFE